MGAFTTTLRLLAAACAATALGLIASAPAFAGEVRVEEKTWAPTDPPPSAYSGISTENKATLAFVAGAGEQNQVTVTATGKSGDSVQLQVIDSGAPLAAGQGCSGGGAPGSPVACTMHAPKAPTQIFCGKMCVQFAPGTGWQDFLRAELGDGNDSFDGGSFQDGYPGQYVELIHGGAGDDRIATGSANDEIDPGEGADEVHSGDGVDRVFATAVADGPDLYDLGADGFDMVSYEARSEPVQASASGGGAAGEADRFEGVEFLVGGSGNDSLRGTYALVGGPGDDQLTGSQERDWIYGSDGSDVLKGEGGKDDLDGENGNDVDEGGPGDDRLEEEPRATEGDNLSLVGTERGSTSGADIGLGGPGHDILDLGPENDIERGQEADDWLYGGTGRDRLYGGPGPDIVAGEAGSDRMWGGSGEDSLRAGHIEEHWYTNPPQPIDTWRDSVNCGGQTDHASVNPWDGVRNCELRRRAPAVVFGRPGHDAAQGTATLPIGVIGPGKLLVSGNGVAPLEVPLDERRYTLEEPLLIGIGAQGAALQRLHRQGHVTLNVVVRLAPTEGPARATRVPVDLRLRRGS